MFSLDSMSPKVVTPRRERLHCVMAPVCLLGLLLAAGCSRPSAASPVSELAQITANAAAPAEAAQSKSTAAEPSEPAAAAVQDHNSIDAAPPPPSEQIVKPKPPPADRIPTRPGDAEKISFDDLNLGMQADMVFRDFMLSDRVKDLEGKKVSIVGYMHGGSVAQSGIKQFILLKNTQCKFGPGGQADHLADVSLHQDQTTKFNPAPVKIEGTLRVQAFQGSDGNTWSIYRLEDAQIK